MSFQSTSQSQELVLSNLFNYLQPGNTMTLIITKAPGACGLEFLHAGDTDWVDHPGFTGTPNSDDVIVQTLVCPSTSMRLKFDSAPAAVDYHVSIIWHTSPDY